jgi:hypothetical protein
MRSRRTWLRYQFVVQWSQTERGEASVEQSGLQRIAKDCGLKAEQANGSVGPATAATSTDLDRGGVNFVRGTAASADQPGFLTEVVVGGNIQGQEAISQVSRQHGRDASSAALQM